MNPKPMIVAALAACLLLASCATRRTVGREDAPVTHVVLVKLKDPSHATDAYRDTFNVLNKVRTAHTLTKGFAYDTGRKEVDGTYDLALLMDFPDRLTYEKYLNSAEHQKLLRVWKPHVEMLRIFDIGREKVANPNVITKNEGVRGPRDVLPAQ